MTLQLRYLQTLTEIGVDLVFQVAASAVSASDDKSVQDQLMRIIQPISGTVSMISYAAVSDRKGTVQSYRVVAQRK